MTLKFYPLISSIDSNFSSELNLRGSYIFGENVTNFIHHQYSKYWDRGIPVIHVADEIIPYQYHILSDMSNRLDDIYREDGISIYQNIAKALSSGKIIDNGILSFREMADECYQRFLIGEGERVGEEKKKTPTK